MKTVKSFGIYFNVRLEKEKDGKAPVYMCITVEGKKTWVALQQKITLKCWDMGRGIGKNTTAEGKMVNAYLDELRQTVNDCYKDLQLKRRVITADAIKASFLRQDDEERTLQDIFQYHNDMAAGVLAKATMKNYYTTQRYLVEFCQQKYKREKYFLSELNFKFIQDFEIFLRKHQPVDHQKPLTTNGIMKHQERLKKMITLAFKLEWIVRDPFDKYQLKFDRVEKEFLTEIELSALENKHLTLPRLTAVRDIFIFSCYTGLAFVDVMNLKPSNIVEAADGTHWVRTSREKTTIPVNVPLLSKAKALVEKYKLNIKASEKGTVFPPLSNQKMNSYLKELAERCDIFKNLTFHTARHTFATTVTLLNGVPIETVSKLLGHTSMRTTQIYAKVIEKKVNDDMADLQRKLA
ncbi:site-specific integrase [Mucilaginibacter galii]|uniref:Transposase n=1 Tax=Mucilaginibacter galii TaxID=2005073 RepID=A0A917JCW5_9SPHI|nr:site-specific integrase [Mucilaginibacter galii]GGI52809.1 transposase [Mucilaginibacter galii]